MTIIIIITIRPDLMITKKKKKEKKRKENLHNCGLSFPGWLQSKIERKRKEREVPEPCLGIEKNPKKHGTWKWPLYQL